MKIYALCAVALAFAVPAAPAAAFTLPEGTYQLTGYNGADATEAAYKGHVFITRTGATYSLVWKIGQQQTQKGVAILSGNVLSVGYFDMSGRDAGVVETTTVAGGSARRPRQRPARTVAVEG